MKFKKIPVLSFFLYFISAQVCILNLVVYFKLYVLQILMALRINCL